MIMDFEGDKLSFFQALYEEAHSAMAERYEEMERHADQYRGSAEIDGSSVPATQVRNITYELIESQVTSYIPTPAVSPRMYSEQNERNAKSIETLLRAKRNELPFERMNDLDERFSPIYGGSVWLIEWDESIRTHTTVGDVRISCISPLRFVGQPNVYEVADMEYCFVTFETTKEEIVRKYGVKYEVAEETESETPEHDDGYTATLYVCYYRNEEDKVCQYVWSGDVELLDLDDYYARRRKICRACGRREGLCSCDKPEYESMPAEGEEVTLPIQRSDGSVIRPECEMIENGQIVTETVKVQAQSESGEMIFDNTDGIVTPLLIDVAVPKMQPTVLPYYTPTTLPVVIRKNTSREDALFGQSDCEVIRPQQQAINKLETRIMEKLLRAGVRPIVPEDYKGTLDGEIFDEVLKASHENVKLFGRLDMQVDISQDIAQGERLYNQAKRILGISDSFQGQYDASAQSGVAKQLQIQQAAGRLDSKRKMKNAAYADIDKVVFGLYLAYADEPRPAAYTDATGARQNISFNRYDFLCRDDAGEWYYEDGYLFAADASVDIEDSRYLSWEENTKNFQAGAFGDPADPYTRLIFWQNMERAHYPWARDTVERIKAQIQTAQQLAALEQRASAAEGEIEGRKQYEEYLKGQIGG